MQAQFSFTQDVIHENEKKEEGKEVSMNSNFSIRQFGLPPAHISAFQHLVTYLLEDLA